MDQVTVDGIHVEITGAGPPVVLTHDALTHSEAWDAQLPAWSADHRVACWDRRGYGRSPRPTTRFSSIDDLATVVRAVSDGPAALVGCSFGSLVALHCELDIADVRAASGALEAGRPGATRVVLTGSGHPPHLEVPDAFTRVVHDFLAKG